MITQDNISEVINSLDDNDKTRLKETAKDYAVIEVLTFNAGAVVRLDLTNDYFEPTDDSTYVFEVEEIAGLIK
jgi:hypothetical protein